MTYSIVARDPDSGQLGIAIQSHFLAVGHQAVWGRAGVGMIASQANVSLDYGLTGLEILASGRSAGSALTECLARDENPEVRQVGMVDISGRTAAHTGLECWDYAAHYTIESVSAQANMVAGAVIPRAMVETFMTTTGTFAHRLLSSLEAAEALGGDLRGRQSSALFIVAGELAAPPDDGVITDLRVDNSAEPLRDLRRASEMHTAFARAWPAIRGPACRGRTAPTASETQEAIATLSAVQQVYGDQNLEPSFWMAVALARSGRITESERLIARIAKGNQGWLVLYASMLDRAQFNQ